MIYYTRTAEGELILLTSFAKSKTDNRIRVGMATSKLGLAAIFLILNVMHGGVKLGRKNYRVDMASGDNRAAYVAVSSTLIGVLMLAGGLIGLIGDWLGAAATAMVLGLLSLIAAAYSLELPEVSEQA